MSTASIQVAPSRAPGLVILKFPYNPHVITFIKQFPGARWNPRAKCWFFPEELVPLLAENFDVRDSRPAFDEVVVPPLVAGLHPYQVIAVTRMIVERRLLLSLDMGLGKTLCAIEAARVAGGSNSPQALVVAPAGVLSVWKDEIEKWWAGPVKPDIQVLRSAKAIRQHLEGGNHGGFTIVSYNMLVPVLTSAVSWRTIIFDEVHNVKEETTLRARMAKDLVSTNPKAYVFGLTGTPITIEPKDIRNQVNTIWPGRFGTYRKFCERYCLKENTWEDKVKYYSLDATHAQEFKYRVDSLSYRKSKSEVAHLLPSLRITPHTLILSTAASHTPAAFSSLTPTQLRVEIARVSNLKLNLAAEYIKGVYQPGEYLTVFTHRRKFTHAMAQKLAQELGAPVTVITGEYPVTKRQDLLDKLRAAGRGILVATMHSLTEGIDLTFCRSVIFAELYPRVSTLVQVINRFHRLSATGSVNATLLVLADTIDEKIAFVVERRLQDIAALLTTSEGESKMLESLQGRALGDEEFLDYLEELEEVD